MGRSKTFKTDKNKLRRGACGGYRMREVDGVPVEEESMSDTEFRNLLTQRMREKGIPTDLKEFEYLFGKGPGDRSQIAFHASSDDVRFGVPTHREWEHILRYSTAYIPRG